MKKTTILIIVVLFMVIGYAAYNVTINVYGNGKLAENLSDFNVYLSNLKVNGKEVSGINNTKDEFTINDINGDISVDIVNNSTEYDTESYLECELEKEETNKIWNYDYTGGEQTFTVPTTGTYKLETWGAQGGSYDSTYTGGNGAYASGKIFLIENKKLYIYVGQENNCVEGSSGNTSGGYNGGGTAGSTIWPNRNFCGGGGATDVRLVNGKWNNINSLKSRIMVAAGGGGANYFGSSYHAIGGSGGGLIGYKASGNNGTAGDGIARGTAGTQFSGAAFGYGEGETTNGGGGGYYGGNAFIWDGGTGGSSFISGHAGSVAILEESTADNIVFKNDSKGIPCNSENSTGYNSSKYNTDYECSKHYSGYVFDNTLMIDGNGYVWTTKKEQYSGQIQPDGTLTAGHLGNGYARITLLTSLNNIATDKVIITAQESVSQNTERISGKSITCKLKVNKISRTNKVKSNIAADPVLSKSLIPVTIADDGKVTYADITKEWYNYEKKIWANAVILEEGKSYKVGDVIQESDIQSYFVWIPRYRYKLFNTNNYSLTTVASRTDVENKAQEIEIEFESKWREVSSGTKNGEWLTHPAFTAFNTNGFWVGKFETGYKGATTTASAQVNSNDTSKVIIKPNVYSWRNINIKNIFETSYNYNREVDSHMMKNTEWGAVAYLSHSKYGIDKEVNINNNSSYKTGYSSLTTLDQSTFPGTPGEGDTYNQPYNTNIGYLASTTGNISGIYDMSGGADEYVSAHIIDTYGASGFSLETIAKYNNIFFDKYNKLASTSTFEYRILGDATGEMGPFLKFTDNDKGTRSHNSWYYDHSNFFENSNPWLARGGSSASGVLAGQFHFNKQGGSENKLISFRIVLTP